MPIRTKHRRQHRFIRPLVLIVGVAVLLLMLLIGKWRDIGIYINHVVYRKPVCSNCNVVIISLDTLSALHLPCYGYSRDTAPQLCAFGKNHTFFPNAYSQSFFTLPSHFSLFTSQYPSTHKMLDIEGAALDPSSTLITQVLKQKGYTTMYFGPVDSDMFPMNRGMERAYDYLEPTYDYDRGNGLRQWQKGVDMLKENDKNGKPTFLFLHTYYVHEPYLPGTRNLHFTSDNVPEIPVNRFEYFSFSEEAITFAKNFFRQNPPSYDPDSTPLFQQFMRATTYETSKRYFEQLVDKNCPMYCIMPYYFYESVKSDARKVAYMKALYDELILQLDSKLHDILTSLDPLLQKDTILVITADHGQAFNEHGSLFHRSLYNEVLKVPLMISVPKVKPRTIDMPVESIDVMPTVLNLLGIPIPVSAEGTDISDVILGHPIQIGKPYIISERFDMLPAYRSFTPVRQRSILDSRWKLYVTSLDSPSGKYLELYDVKRDPWDTRNVASLHPDIVNSMLTQLNEFGRTHGVQYPALETPPPVTPTPQQQRYFHY